MASPVFPITFHWLATGEVEAFESIKDIECSVENFDSDTGAAKVVDAQGLRVRIRVSLLNLEAFELL